MEKELLGIKASQEEVNDLFILLEKKARFEEMRSSPPSEIGQATAYFKALLDNLAEAEILIKAWWGGATQRYKLPNNASLDFATCEFFLEKKN